MQMHRAANNALIAHANQNSAEMQEAIGEMEASSHLVLSNQEKMAKSAEADADLLCQAH